MIYAFSAATTAGPNADAHVPKTSVYASRQTPAGSSPPRVRRHPPGC